MKKGFTLIELLAVIVILAVLALIATPIVLNIIDDSKKNATLRSSENYIKAVEFSIAKSVMENKKLSDGEYPLMESGNICLGTLSGSTCDNELVVEVSGETPESGTITIKSRKIDSYEFTYASGFVVVNGEIQDTNSTEESLPAFAKAIVTKAKDNNYYYETTPDFSVATVDGEYGLYQALDDLGTSYYFRGDTEDNYVQFGNYYWRIVRVNGDGTIRMIYDGAEKVHNGMIHDASIGEDYWEDGEGSYTGQLGNLGLGTNDSSIKQIIDKWYADNLKTTYSSYIADSIFCNDREVTFETYYMITEEDWIETDKDTAIEFGDYIVDYQFAAESRFGKNLAPKLTCTREEDRYTINENLGNGLLSNPIALLTADEAIMAGTTKSKSSYYLNTFGDEEYSWDVAREAFYWTMTPVSYWDVANVFNFGNYLSNTDINGNGSEIRPVINLKADVSFTGDGSYDNPYVIVTE